MSPITFGDHLIDSGYYDITPEQERELDREDERRRNAKRYWTIKQKAREECERRGIDPDEICADGGIEAWMIIAKEVAT
jgi:hypothetical protein